MPLLPTLICDCTGTTGLYANRGIDVGGKEVKLGLFADDMLLLISKPVEFLSNIMIIINNFSAFASFRVNYSKFNLLPISTDTNFFTSHMIK